MQVGSWPAEVYRSNLKMAGSSADTSMLSLNVTQEQRNTIEALFNHNNWNFVPVEDDIVGETEELDHELLAPRSCQPKSNDPNDNKCIHCICRPCITSDRFRQLWWPIQCHPARRRNSSLRRNLYKKYWTMLYHRGVWAMEEYQQ